MGALRHVLTFAAAAALACGDSSTVTGATDETTGETTEDPSTTAATIATSTTDLTTGTGSDSGDSDSSTDTLTTTGLACEPMLDNGEVCDDDCECFSNSCFTVPFVGGSCGECKVDDDCPDGGCTIPNPWGMEGATCNMGEPGKGCETDEVCADPDFAICATIIEADGLFALKTCSECATNDDCGGDTPNCAPEIDLETFTGILKCVADGTLLNDQPCQHPDQLDPACASGVCSLADVEGILMVGLCGECLADSDCAMGQTCTDAWVDLGANGIDGLHGSICR